MPSNKNIETSEKSEKNELTIKEVSAKLDISEATVKKYLKDFELESEKGTGNKAVISEVTFQALSEIVKLRTNGLSIQEIKELKSQKPSKNILDEIEETESSKAQEEKEEKGEKEEIKNGDLLEDVQEEIDFKSEKEEDDDKDKIKDINVQEQEEQTGEQQGEESPRRRRGFNYRYVERQISNDSKRVGSLRLRLRNTNLSVQERLFVEEALERRILFLDGWKHILRWISK